MEGFISKLYTMANHHEHIRTKNKHQHFCVAQHVERRHVIHTFWLYFCHLCIKIFYKYAKKHKKELLTSI